MTAPDAVYMAIYNERTAKGDDIEQIAVPADLYESAYLEMYRFFLQPGEIVESVNGAIVPVTRPVFPLPVPKRSYTLWGVEVVKAE